MKFVFVKGGSVWWPVKWLEPVDGGGTAEQSIEVRFKRLPWEAASAIKFQMTIDFIRSMATDWRDIVDDAGRPVAFDDDALTEMAGRLAFLEALIAAFFECLRALPETRQGNSEASLAGGPAAGEAAAPAPVADGATAPVPA